jgi:putative ABC transport system permease protein
MPFKSTVRGLLHVPSFAVAVVLTIALGVGASSAMFSVVYAALLRPLPYPAADRLVVVWEKWQVNHGLRDVDPDAAARLNERVVVTDRALQVWRAQNHVFEDIAGFLSQGITLTGTGEPRRVEGLIVTSQFFRVLGVSPAVGRAFRREEDQLGTDEVVLIGHRLWMTRFGGDPHVIGKTMRVDGMPHTIVGIMAADFHLALPNAPRDPDVVLPLPHSFTPDRRWTLLTPVARLKPGVALPAAQADMSAVVRRMAETNPRYKTCDANVVSLGDEIGRDSRPALLVLFGATMSVLLIGCANVANLLLLRATARQKELAIRTALGAGRWQMARDVVVESIGLAVVGGMAGLVLAHWGTAVLVAVVPEHLFPRLEDVRVDWVVLSFGSAAAVVVGVLAAVVPVWGILRGDRRGRLCTTLNDARRTATTSRGQRSVRRALVIAQVAIAMVLLVGAGLLTETYLRLTYVDLGVNPAQVLTFKMTLPQARYSSDASRLAFQDALLSRLAALPGVEAAGLTSALPVGSQSFATVGPVAVEGRPQDDHEFLSVATVSPGFFAAAGTRLAYGRLLNAADARADVAVASRTLVRRYWPSAGARGPEPIGRRLLIGEKWCTLVGVVNDVRYAGPDKPAEPLAYVPLSYWPLADLAAVVRTTGNPVALTPLVRQALRSVDSDMPIQDVRTLEEVASRSVAPPRFRFVLIVVFAALAVLLAVIGLYGVVSQSVAERRQEIGVRMVLGAGRSAIARMILLEGLAQTAAGIVFGIAASLASTRLLARFLFGVEAMNVATFASVGVGLAVVGVVACWAPARRAMGADPAVVLRAE